jgi:hypothetical protein
MDCKICVSVFALEINTSVLTYQGSENQAALEKQQVKKEMNIIFL